ncbi:MAG TPA: thiamine pyrophosphate-dependent enzyme [bacterium]|nr:thiamine pyrophosphate-dependent enzyme [bacterium]
MKKIFGRTPSLTDAPTHYCGGCGHGIVHRVLCEVIDELGLRESTVGIAPVGCAVLGYDYWNFDVSEAAHGRTPAVATGMKRARPDLTVFSYQGDGDLAAIGTAEIIHAANRGERITVIFVNNTVYGMTGGQMAPTTLVGQKTLTSPHGRKFEEFGEPIRVVELLSQFRGTAYAARTSVHNPVEVIKTKKAIKKAFQAQVDGIGFSIVEILSQCPTYWGMTPVQSVEYVRDELVKYFPLGTFKDETGAKASAV